MADDKRAREKQARDADRRQRERDIQAELERGEEPEPPVELDDEAALTETLREVDFPATGVEVVAEVGEVVVTSGDRRFAVSELVPSTATETFETAEAVEAVVRRPRVALAMKRILEASAAAATPLKGSKRAAYERTLLELCDLDADDEDESVREVTDWVLERIRDTGSLPASRAVRRHAAEVCRTNGYVIRDDEWLGV